MSSSGEEGKKVGVVTSVVVQDETAFALAYLKCKRRGEQVAVEGTQVSVNGEPAKARSSVLPLLARHGTERYTTSNRSIIVALNALQFAD